MKKITKETNRIILPYGNASKLAADLGLGRSTVFQALRGVKAMSESTYFNVRNKAIDLYGGRYLL